ncbi:hypothetical protein [Nocardia asiatica]|uniref:hypothetical protein n=1 Tax=Nocardia asiatica TaxID=209252 RepID=UPI0002FDA3C9|nr:hypothetical protein [Nocardia asiatica]
MSADRSEGWRALGVELSGFGAPISEDPDQSALFDISYDTPPPRPSATSKPGIEDVTPR